MNTNAKTSILLAVDTGPREPGGRQRPAIEMASELAARCYADQVIVLHVREFAVARLLPMMNEHGGADGQRAVDEIVTSLRAAGVNACGLVREADAGHVASAILDAAAEFNARLIVLCAPRRHVLAGSVATHLLHLAGVPVVVARQEALTGAGAGS